DTGTPAGGPTVGLLSKGDPHCAPNNTACLDIFQFLGGRFTLPQAASLTSIEFYMDSGPGLIAVKISTETNNIPGQTLFSKTYTLASNSGWMVFSNYNLQLPAGTYWVTFEPIANGGLSGHASGNAPVPLSAYGGNANTSNGWFNAGQTPPLFGVRV